MRTRIKFCGCTSAADAELAVACGVDAIGVIFAPQSSRRVELDVADEIARRVPAFVARVAVFVAPRPADVAIVRAAGYLPQFSGDESAAECEAAAAGGPYIKVQHISPGAVSTVESEAFARRAPSYPHATWMFDTYIDGKRGGTGQSFDWDIACALARDRPIIMSGGLAPETVGACIRRVRPFGVDVRSGIETGGVKDRSKMRAFVRAVREADEQA